MALIDPFELQVAALHDCAASRRVEQEALAPLPPLTLMRLAGRAVARLVLALSGEIRNGPIVVVAGRGHNGGDGWAAALELKRARRDVLVWEPLGCSAPDAIALRREALEAHVPLTGIEPTKEIEEDPVEREWTPSLDPAQAAKGTPADTAPDDRAEPDLRRPDERIRAALVIDALLGLGGSGAIRPHAAAAIEWMQSQADAGVPVLSIDLPSGLCGDTGNLLIDGEGRACAVRADHTLSLLTLKTGLFTGQGREQSGRLWFDDLGCSSQTKRTSPGAELATGRTFNGMLRASRRDARGRWRHDGHKGSHGDAWIVGGAPGMAGAAVLAARAALRAGAGRVLLYRLDGVIGDHGTPEVMGVLHGADDIPPRGLPCTVVAGCGGGALMAPLLPRLLHAASRLVLDADALNALAADTRLQQRLKARHRRGLATVITPHPLEAARLLGCSTAEVQGNRPKAACDLAERLACTVVLKGSGTITATPGHTPWINASGNARLSTAGTGDVLAGWIGGAWSSLSAEHRTGEGTELDGASALALSHRVAAACVELHGMAAGAASGVSRMTGATGMPAAFGASVASVASVGQAGPASADSTAGAPASLLTAGDLIERMSRLL